MVIRPDQPGEPLGFPSEGLIPSQVGLLHGEDECILEGRVAQGGDQAEDDVSRVTAGKKAAQGFDAARLHRIHLESHRGAGSSLLRHLDEHCEVIGYLEPHREPSFRKPATFS